MSNQDDKKRVHNCNTYQNNYPRSFAYSNKQRNPVPEHNFLIMDDPMSIKVSNTMSNQDDKKRVHNCNTYRNNYPRSFAYSNKQRNPVPEHNFLIMDDPMSIKVSNTMSNQDDKKQVYNFNTYRNNYPRSFAYSIRHRNPVPG
eukprot:1027637_1